MPTHAHGLQAFLVLWFGQLVSVIGSGMTSFLLAIWVFERTGSTGQLAFVVLASALPAIAIAPLAGLVIDRRDRRWTMIWSVLGAALCTLAMAALFSTGNVRVWHIYPVVIGISVCGAFQGPALSASVTFLVPKEHYGRASALWQLHQAASMIVSPLLATAILQVVRMSGVILIDASTYLVAVATLLFITIPRPAVSAAARRSMGSLAREAAFGWTYLRSRRGLFQLMVYFAFVHVILDITQILVMPFVLSGGSPRALAMIMAVSASGMVVGSVVMTAWRGPRQRIVGVVGSGAVLGVALLLTGLQTRPVLMAAALFLFTLAIPLGMSCAGALWLSKTEPDVQGRVFSAKGMVNQLTFPVACLLAGPLADRLFGPLLVAGGPLSGSLLGRVFGVGPGRGVGLLMATLGLLTVFASLAAYASPRLRLIEDELPDVASAPQPAAEPVPVAAAGTVPVEPVELAG